MNHPHDPIAAGEELAFLVGGKNGALMRSIDWSRTSLGPVRDWPQSLRTALSICMSSRFPISLYWGPEFHMLYNDDLLPMVGANKHPWALGRPAFEVLPEIREIIEPLLKKVVETGEAIWSEDLMLPLQRGDAQEEGYFTFTYSPVRDESGGVGGVFCAVLETTDKVIEGRRLRLLNALAQATQAKTPIEACVLAALQIRQAPSDIPFALFYLLDEASSVLRLAGTANIDAGSQLAPAVIAAGDHSLWPLDVSANQGKPRFVQLKNAPGGARGAVVLPIERAGGGRPLGFIVAGLSALLRTSESYERFHHLLASSVSQCVSNAAAYEAERQRAEALAELDRAKTAFFSNVSHEFRTPLTLMLAPIEDMMSLPPGSPVDHSAVELLSQNARRLMKLVNTLLEFSRIEAGRVKATYRKTDLAALTSEVASMFRSTFEKAGLKLSVDTSKAASPVFVDHDMWEKIVLNLLSNAFKFTFAGGVQVRLTEVEGHARLTIKDSGTGIPKKELPRLFERFHRVEGSKGRSYEGTGIGLALVQELVKIHGGSIQVASEEGKGTEFQIDLPLGASHLPSEQIATADNAPANRRNGDSYLEEAANWSLRIDTPPAGTAAVTAAGAAKRDTESPARKPRILFADDNGDMRSYVKNLLQNDWDVELASDGETAFELARKFPPDLILSDVMMPGLNGFELIQKLKKNPRTQNIPVILLSARAGEEAKIEGLSAGADDYLVKPFSGKELIARIKTHLQIGYFREGVERERSKFSAVFAQAPVGIAVLEGPDHVFTIANSFYGSLFYGGRSNFIGRSVREAVPEAVEQGFVTLLDRVYQTGEPFIGKEIPIDLVQVDGTNKHFYLNFVYQPLRDDEQKIYGIVAVIQDVTEQVQSRATLETVFQESPAAMVLWRGPDLVFDKINPGYQAIFSDRELLGKPFTEALPETKGQPFEHWIKHVFESGEAKVQPEQLAKLILYKGGPIEDRYFDMSFVQVMGVDNKPYGVYEHAVDVTDRVRSRREMEKSKVELETTVKSLEQEREIRERFVATLTHDLRTPLTAAKMSAQLIHKKAVENEALQKLAAKVTNGIDRADEMIRDLLDANLIRAGQKLPIEVAPCNLNEVAADTIAELGTVYGDRFVLSANESINGSWSAHGVRRILENLCGNAVKYGASQSPVQVALALQPDNVTIEVKNEGPAIPLDEQSYLFEPFRRSSSALTGGKKGWGLGLTLVKGIAEAHGGTVRVSSSTDEGTRFKVLLPRP